MCCLVIFPSPGTVAEQCKPHSGWHARVLQTSFPRLRLALALSASSRHRLPPSLACIFVPYPSALITLHILATIIQASPFSVVPPLFFLPPFPIISVLGRVFFIPLRPYPANQLAYSRCLPAPIVQTRFGRASAVIRTAKYEPFRVFSPFLLPWAHRRSRALPPPTRDRIRNNLFLSNATPDTTSTAVPQKQAWSDSYLAMTRPSSLRDSWNAAVWEKT